MTYNSAHSTLFFNKSRLTINIILISAVILVLHFIMLSIFPADRRTVSNIIWLAIELVKLPLVIVACVKSRDLIRRGWLFFVIYCVLFFSRIGERAFYDIILHDYRVLPGSYFVFVAGNISVILAFLMFSHSSEVSFKIKRQLNLLGLIFTTIVLLAYVINYKPVSVSVTPTFIIYTTISSVINISSFIIGLGIYWISIRSKNDKRRVVFILLLLSIFMTFIINNFYFSPRLIAGKPVTGSYFDLLPTLTMMFILSAAIYEILMKETDKKSTTYNLFYVPRIERVIPVITIVIIIVTFYFNTSKADLFLIKSILLIFIPYCLFLFFFEIYSYRSEDAIISVMGVSPAGVHITDRTLNNTFFINKSLAEMYRGSEISPDFIFRGSPSPEKDRIRNLIPSLASVENSEILITRADGTEFTAECIIIPARYYSYDIIITWVLDITDRKKYEKVILEEKKTAETRSIYLSGLLDNLSNRIWSGYATFRVDDSGWPDFTITRANERIIERFDLPKDIVGMKFSEVFPEMYSRNSEKLFKVLSTGESMRRELHEKQQNRFFNLVVFKTQENEIGCLVDDITEKKNQERELIEREREISTLLGNLPGMAYRSINTHEFTMLFASEGCVDLTGYTHEELTGNNSINWGELIHHEDREMVWNSIQQAVGSRENFNINYRLIAKDSSVKYVWDKGLGVFNDRGDLMFLEGFVLDVTKEKEAEIILRDFERREMEMEKARAVGQLAGGIAHDLNNKLMAIGSSASLLELKIRDEEIKKYTGRIQEGIKQSAELIDNLLTFARQSNTVMDIFSIHSMILKLLASFESGQYPGIRFINESGALHEMIKGDSRQIEKSVSGIISNAIEAMPDGGEVIIRTENLPIEKTPLYNAAAANGSRETILIRISDSGVGIENENLSRIFDPFYTTKPVGKGSGLGLSAVYGAIQANRGIITVESSPERGTTFMIFLPVEE